MNDDIDAVKGGCDRARISEIRLDRVNARGADEIRGERRPVEHQAEMRHAARQMPPEQRPHIPGRSRDENLLWWGDF
jgi:hypothetical protein